MVLTPDPGVGANHTIVLVPDTGFVEQPLYGSDTGSGSRCKPYYSAFLSVRLWVLCLVQFVYLIAFPNTQHRYKNRLNS